MNIQVVTDQGLEDVTIDFVKSTFCVPENVQITSLMYPVCPGVASFTVKLEFEVFEPETEANDDFLLAFIEFERTMWSVVSFPMEKKPDAERIARECGLKLVQATPIIFTVSDLQFPVISCALPETRETITEQLGDRLLKMDIFPIDIPTLHVLETDDTDERVRLSNDPDAIARCHTEMAMLEQFFKEKLNGRTTPST